MLTSRGQENLVHARPAVGKALLPPKTPNYFQTPGQNNRAPLGAKTTNAKAQTVLKGKDNGKLQVFKTPAPGPSRRNPERTTNRSTTTRRSDRSKITVPSAELAHEKTITKELEIEDDEPDFGYAPPPPKELRDVPIEFDYDHTFPQFKPENMFRGYGEIYHASPKDENGFSLRLKREEEEYHQYLEEQEREYNRRMREQFSKPLIISDDEFDIVHTKTVESNPDTLKSRSAASALSGIRVPSVANKHTASSRLKINKSTTKNGKDNLARSGVPTLPRPLSVSRNTIGYPKAKKPPTILPSTQSLNDGDDLETLVDAFDDFEFFPPSIDDDDDLFQLPVPE